MSIVDFLFTKTIEDEMFGKLTSNRLSGQYWQGKIKFVPAKSEIYIYIWDLEDNVSREHKQFYKELELRYLEITKDIAHLLNDPPESMGDSPHKEFNEFNLVSLSFPSVKSLNTSSFDWDMCFSLGSEKVDLSIGMENWKLNKDECCFE